MILLNQKLVIGELGGSVNLMDDENKKEGAYFV